MRNDKVKPARNTICLWYDHDAENAARFYARTFPDSSVGAVHQAPGDFPSGKKGNVLTVEFEPDRHRLHVHPPESACVAKY